MAAARVSLTPVTPGPDGEGAREAAPLRVSQLSPAQIREFAEDHYRGLLSIDDEVSTNPSCDPEGIRSWLAAAGEDVAAPGFNLAERWVTYVTAMSGIAQDSLKARDLDRYGRATEREADNWTEIRSESLVDNLLARHSVSLDPTAADYRRLANAVMMADARAWADISKRLDGVAVETPLPPATLRASAYSPRLREVFAKWVAERKPPPKTESDFRAYVERFIEFNGNVPVKSIGRGQVIAFKEALLEYPARPPSKVAKKSVPEVIVWARANPDQKRLTAKTINEKIIGGISAVFGWAVANDLMEFNPRAGCAHGRGTERDSRLPYDAEDLRTVFSSAIFLGGDTLKGGRRSCPMASSPGPLHGREALRTRPAQDGRRQGSRGIDYLDMLRVEQGKKRKNNASRKRVPIHAEPRVRRQRACSRRRAAVSLAVKRGR